MEQYTFLKSAAQDEQDGIFFLSKKRKLKIKHVKILLFGHLEIRLFDIFHQKYFWQNGV